MTAATGHDQLAASLIRGDAAFRLQRRLGLIPREGLGVGRRAVFYALVTWLPIAVWAWWRGRVLGGALDDPLMHHFGVNVRCLIAIPLLVLAEGVAHAISMRLLPHFVDAGIGDGIAGIGDHDLAGTNCDWKTMWLTMTTRPSPPAPG